MCQQLNSRLGEDIINIGVINQDKPLFSVKFQTQMKFSWEWLFIKDYYDNKSESSLEIRTMHWIH